MDKLYGPPWHCIVGKGFGSGVTYKNNHFLYMYISNKAIMIYKHWSNPSYLQILFFLSFFSITPFKFPLLPPFLLIKSIDLPDGMILVTIEVSKVEN